MATFTPVLTIQQIEPGEDGTVTFNEAIRILEAFSKSVFKDRLLTPPGTVAPGEVYLIDGTGTGAWSGKDNKIAVVLAGTVGSTATYHYITRAEGMQFYVEDDNQIIYFNTTWQVLHTGL